VTWEPRIRVEAVDATIAGDARSRLDIRIEYRVRATNTFYNLVYPFYAQEGGEEGRA
jgi:phage baseplate assembly protein W